MKKAYQRVNISLRILEIDDVVRTSTRDGENFGFIGGWSDWGQWIET